jgi:hypothetical protein
MSSDDRRQSWWQTLPGVLTAVAGVLTAVTGLYIAVVQNREDEAKTSPPAVAEAPARSAAPASSEPVPAGAPRESKAALPPPSGEGGRSDALKPWSESDAVLTMTDGSRNTVRAESLSNYISVSHSITLTNGQGVPFERMRSLEVVRSDATGSPNARATIVVTLLDGRTINGTMDAGCGWFGFNDIGRFDFNVDRLRRVEFGR